MTPRPQLALSPAPSSPRLPGRHPLVLALPLLALPLGVTLLAGCSPEPTPTPTSAPPTETSVPPTMIVRMEPSPTPTIDPAEQPLYPVESEVMRGVPVPLAAELIDHERGSADKDGRAEYGLPDFDQETIYDWYREHMPEFGWGDVEDRDGSLVFLHDSELSQRFADEGLKRTATILFFTLDDGADWSLIVESALDEDADDEGDASDDGEEGDEGGAEGDGDVDGDTDGS